jgi:hypothetical protein
MEFINEVKMAYGHEINVACFSSIAEESQEYEIITNSINIDAEILLDQLRAGKWQNMPTKFKIPKLGDYKGLPNYEIILNSNNNFSEETLLDIGIIIPFGNILLDQSKDIIINKDIDKKYLSTQKLKDLKYKGDFSCKAKSIILSDFADEQNLYQYNITYIQSGIYVHLDKLFSLVQSGSIVFTKNEIFVNNNVCLKMHTRLLSINRKPDDNGYSNTYKNYMRNFYFSFEDKMYTKAFKAASEFSKANALRKIALSNSILDKAAGIVAG